MRSVPETSTSLSLVYDYEYEVPSEADVHRTEHSMTFSTTQLPYCSAATLLDSLVECSGSMTPVVDETAQRTFTLKEAYAICADVTRVHSRSFFFSSQLLPPEKRQAIRALYAFCRLSDDVVDTQSAPSGALARWVAQSRSSEPLTHHAVLLAWHDTVRRYQIPRDLIDELLAGLAMDLLIQRYPTFNDLWLYCYRVASVVGLMVMHIVGYEPDAVPYAVRLGIALQLTNILRDIGEDTQRGRIYVPQEDLERFGVSPDDILAGRRSRRFEALMCYEIARAQAYYEDAWPGIAMLSSDSQLAVAAAAEIYRGILGKIEQNKYDVFTKRAHLSLFEKCIELIRVRRRLQRLQRRR